MCLNSYKEAFGRKELPNLEHQKHLSSSSVSERIKLQLSESYHKLIVCLNKLLLSGEENIIPKPSLPYMYIPAGVEAEKETGTATVLER